MVQNYMWHLFVVKIICGKHGKSIQNSNTSYNDWWKNCMLRVVSQGHCTVYHALVRFCEKKCKDGHFGCCLPCVTPHWLFYKLIKTYSLQMNNEMKNEYFNTFNSSCMKKWANWYVTVTMDWMNKHQRNNSLIDCSSTFGFLSRIQHIGWKLIKRV